MKTCKQCQLKKPTTAFSPSGAGYKSKCKHCRAKNERNKSNATGLKQWVDLVSWPPPGMV